jgi:LmbE family N-acetylglucosaminyl deacetylase
LREASKKRIVTREFRDGFFPSQNTEIKELFEEIKAEISPTLVLTHYRDDRHQDHRIISDLSWNTFRDHLIWEYEIPKYDGDLGNPNLYVRLDDEIGRRKIGHIMEAFVSQRSKHWFTEDTFSSMLRIRGIESGASSKYAEGFFCRKIVL